MSQRTLHLPIRALSSAPARHGPQWVCRRCLATTTTSSSTTAVPPPPKKPASEAESYDSSLLSSQRDYKLTKTDFYLKKGIAQRIPPQYLVHSTSTLLPQAEQAQREQAQIDHKHKPTVGVVISAGKMDKTVKVRLPDQQWNKKIKKYFATHKTHLVHDPANSLLLGDVVALHRLRVSTRVRYVVAHIVSPFGKPLSERPPVPTADDRLAAYKQQRFAKLHRRSLRRQAAEGKAAAIAELRSMGLNPGRSVEAGKAKASGVQLREAKKRAVVGSKGQKSSDGVLPGERHEDGKMNDKARANMGKAMRDERKAEANLKEANAMGERVDETGTLS